VLGMGNLNERDTKMKTKEMTEKLSSIGEVSLRKGIFTVKKRYFYRNGHGHSPEKMAEQIKRIFPNAEIVEMKDDWNSWPKDSSFIVKFKI
jgi:hypothetical protein